jgi:hypothetical protein
MKFASHRSQWLREKRKLRVNIEKWAIRGHFMAKFGRRTIGRDPAEIYNAVKLPVLLMKWQHSRRIVSKSVREPHYRESSQLMP